MRRAQVGKRRLAGDTARAETTDEVKDLRRESTALKDRPGRRGRVWNRIPEDVRAAILDMALEQSELSPQELAVSFTDSQGYFVSEASVYRLLKSRDLITSPAFIVMKAAKAFTDKTTAPNQM